MADRDMRHLVSDTYNLNAQQLRMFSEMNKRYAAIHEHELKDSSLVGPYWSRTQRNDRGNASIHRGQ